MADFTDEKQEMLDSFVKSSTKTMQQIGKCIDSTHEVTTKHQEALSHHSDAIQQLMDRSETHHQLFEKMSSCITNLNSMIDLVAKEVARDK